MFLKDYANNMPRHFVTMLFISSFSYWSTSAQEIKIDPGIGRTTDVFAYPFADITNIQLSYDRLSLGTDNYYNTWMIRGVQSFNKKMHLRADIPLATTVSNSGKITGLEDISLRFSYIFHQHKRSFFGSRLRLGFPTASADELGSGKYTVEPAIGFIHFLKEMKGSVLTGIEYRTSFAGENNRPDISRVGFIFNIDRWFEK